jgi:hypothetical protein
MAEQPAPVEEIRRGTRFRAFPGRQVRAWGGAWITDPVYRVTSVRRYADSREVYYRLDDESQGGAQSHASLRYLAEHGLEIVK